VSLLVTLNSVNYIIPTPQETGWGTNLDNFFVGIAAGCLQKSGGSFTLAADVDFGASFGLKSLYYNSRSANIATSGTVRLASADPGVVFRNNANSANLILTTNASDQLTFNGNIIPTDLASITPKSFLYGDASGNIASTSNPTNGQLLIGSTGAIPAVATLTGTTNQVNVVTGAGSITLSTPQNIHSGASPTFAGLTDTGLTANSFLYSGTSSLLTTTSAPTNGQLLIGSTGAAPVAALLTGTTNQIVVTPGAGSVTLSTPQNIATSSSPTFAALTLTAALTVANGGTGLQSTTAYAVLCGGTTSTGALQSIAGVGNSGQVLTSNGAGALPTFQNVAGTGTVNSGTAGRLSLYNTSTNAVSDTYVQNAQNITIAIATQAARSAALAITLPNPGNAVTTANVLLDSDTNSYTIAGNWTFSNSILGASGTSSAPSFSFSASSGAGMYRSAANEISFSTNSTQRWKIISTGDLVSVGNQNFGFGDGTVSAPGLYLASNTGTGFYKSNTNEISIATNSTQRFRFSATGDFVGSSGSNINASNTNYQVGGNQIYPVVQIVQATTTTGFNTTSTSFTNTNLTATITPKFNTSKILIQISGGSGAGATSPSSCVFTIARGSTNLGDATNGFGRTDSSTADWPTSICYYDSPATTSATTYTIQIKSTGGATVYWSALGGTQVIILTEYAQ
jgi:hypothetical protein